MPQTKVKVRNQEIIEFKPLSKTTIEKARTIFTSSDFVPVNGRYEATRDSLLKLLASLPVSYNLSLINQTIINDFSSVTVRLTVRFRRGSKRQTDAIGACQMSEVRGDKTIHNMIASAETRAIKRAVEVIFGSIINALILEVKGSYKAK